MRRERGKVTAVIERPDLPSSFLSRLSLSTKHMQPTSPWRASCSEEQPEGGREDSQQTSRTLRTQRAITPLFRSCRSCFHADVQIIPAAESFVRVNQLSLLFCQRP